MMENFIQDVRYGFQKLWRRPGFTFVAVLTLALGIGANSAIFSVVNAALLRPLPYKDSERVMMVWEKRPRQNRNQNEVTPEEYSEWKTQNTVFEFLAASEVQNFNLTGTDEPTTLLARKVSQEYFSVLGVDPVYGRTFLPEEDKPGGARVVSISSNLWERRFASDPAIVGKSITLDNNSYTVVGIMPSVAERAFDIWVPLVSEPNGKLKNSHSLYVIGRLKNGVSIQQAQSEMETIALRLEQASPKTQTGHTVNIITVRDQIIGGFRPILFILLGVVGLVLLIACTNVANLLLARAAARHKEMAIRLALGARRLRIVRQLLTESLLLALIGGSLGLLLGMWGIDLILTSLPTGFPLTSLSNVGMDYRVFGFTLLVSLLTGIVFGLVPALQASKADLNESLKEGGRGTSEGATHHRFRSALIITEFALALILLIGAGLLIKSFLRLQDVDPGFKAENVLVMGISLPPAKYAESYQQSAFFQDLLRRAQSLPQVNAAGAITNLPIGGGSMSRNFTIEGRPAAKPGEDYNAVVNIVAGDYFRAMGIPLRVGRVFTEQDRLEAPPVLIINQTLARRFWPNEDPLGKRLQVAGSPVLSTVVGIVGDVKQRGLGADAKPEIFGNYQQYPAGSMTVTLSTAGDATTLATALRSEIRTMDSYLPLGQVKTMDEIVAESVSTPRVYALLLGAFSLLALILAAMGLYGVMAYSVTERTREMGVRMALGAKPRDILTLVIKKGMILAAIGMVIGLGGALALTRVLSSLLFTVSPTDPLTFVVISAFLILVTFAACYVPARRATRIDPVDALRYE